MDPVRPLRGINRVAWDPILSHCTTAQIIVWSGLLWTSICDIAGYFQNVSQNQPVQPVAAMIAIVLLYFWCKSYVDTT